MGTCASKLFLPSHRLATTFLCKERKVHVRRRLDSDVLLICQSRSGPATFSVRQCLIRERVCELISELHSQVANSKSLNVNLTLTPCTLEGFFRAPKLCAPINLVGESNSRSNLKSCSRVKKSKSSLTFPLFDERNLNSISCRVGGNSIVALRSIEEI
jgi:hypothetical protein